MDTKDAESTVNNALRIIKECSETSSREMQAFEALLDEFLPKVKEEVLNALRKFGNFRSAHEGVSIVREEFEEMWEEVRKDDNKAAAKEAMQVAAMSTLFAITYQADPFRKPKEVL